MASKSGYACTLFLAEPDDDLKCLICLGVARDPLQHEECGRLFCKWCIQEYGKDKPCPHCRDQRSSYFLNKKDRRAIQALKVKCSNAEGKCEWEGTVEALEKHEASCYQVKCSNAERECEWEGTVEALEKHEAMCDYALLPCPKECKADRSNQVTHVLRKALVDHLEKECPLRDYQCLLCGERGTYACITQLHPQVCENKPISCPECKETVLQGRKRKHLNEECEVADQSCKYVGLGCGVKMKRRDRVAHEQDVKVHFDMALDTISTMRKDQKQHTTFRVTEYQDKKERNRWFNSQKFYTSSTGYNVHVGVYANGCGDGDGTHVSVCMKVWDGEYDSQLNWPLVGVVTFTLLNQLEDKNHHSETLTLTNVRKYDCKWINKFIPHSALDHDSIKNRQYLMDDTLYFMVSVKVEDDDMPWLTTY